MFTGIIEEVGTLKSMAMKGASGVLTVGCSTVLEDTKIGDSIAVNGVCLTVTGMTAESFAADISYETVKKSSLSGLTPGAPLNLERALTLTTRLGGHLVSGHVDGLGTVERIVPKDESYELTVRFPKELDRYIAEKGSVGIDGISLTVASMKGLTFTVAVIPHTYRETNLAKKRAGNPVNLEVDVVARYLEKLLKNERNADMVKKSLGDLAGF